MHEVEIKTFPNEDLHSNWLQQGHIECLEYFAFEQVGRRDYFMLQRCFFYDLSLLFFQLP